MKLAIVFLTLAVALSMGQNYYLNFIGSKNQPFQPHDDVVVGNRIVDEVQLRCHHFLTGTSLALMNWRGNETR